MNNKTIIPKVSVLMPVYNAAKFLDESIQSVLNQTFTDFEFLILDDASTDNSLAVIKKYQQQDNRIRVFQNKKNQGISKSTNFLMQKAKTEFAALLDSDDACLPERLKIQYNFFKKNYDIDILGGNALYYNDNFYGKPTENFFSEKIDWNIKSSLLILPTLINSSVMMRLKKIRKYNIQYDSKRDLTQDYKFFVDCAEYCNFSNLKKILIKKRFHTNQASYTKSKIQVDFHLEITRNHLKKFGVYIAKENLKILLGGGEVTYEFLLEIKEKFFDHILKIKNFYGYKCIDQRIVYKFIYSKAYRKLGIKGKWLFIKNYGLKNYFQVKTL